MRTSKEIRMSLLDLVATKTCTIRIFIEAIKEGNNAKLLQAVEIKAANLAKQRPPAHRKTPLIY